MKTKAQEKINFWRLVDKHNAQPAIYKETSPHHGYYTCPFGCVLQSCEFIAENTDYVCDLLFRCEHGYFYYSV